MVSVYEVYLDILFLDNMVANLIVLSVMTLIMDRKAKIVSLFGASGLGALFSACVLCMRIRYGLLYVTVAVVVDFAKLGIMGIYGKKSVAGIIYMNTLLLAFSGFYSCVCRIWGSKGALGISIIIFLLLAAISNAISRHSRLKSKQKKIYKVILKDKDTHIEANALYDSGNMLCEPISHKAVSVIEKTPILDNLKIITPEKFKIIPYKSVGNEHGMLEGVEIEQLIIQCEDRQVVKNNAVIALYDGKLSENGGYTMLLNHSLL